jgi:hypothetical protein
VLADHRKQVAEQLALGGRQVLGDRVDRGSGAVRVVGADLDVPGAIKRLRTTAVLGC